LRRRNRDRIEQRARGSGEPRGAGEHGVADGLGNVLSGCEHLGDEERIPARSLV
jgi:hypothetical protein